MVPILHCVKGFHPLNSQGGNDFCPLLISLRSIKSPLEVFCDCRPANLIDQEPKAFSRQSSPQSQKIFCSLNTINPEETETAFGQTSPAKYLLQRSRPPLYINPSDCGIRISVRSRPCDISATSHSTLRHPHSFMPFGLRMCLPLRVQHPPYPLSFYCGFSDFPPHFRIGILREYTLRASLLFRRATPRPSFLEPVSRCLVALSSHKKRSHRYCTIQSVE